MNKLVVIALVATVGASTALAQTPPVISSAMTAQIDKQFAALDTNRDGNISRAEFGPYAQERAAQQDREFEAAFRSLDTNRDSKVTAIEAKANPLLAQYFSAVDTSGDKTISRGELHAAMIAARDAGLDVNQQ